jgi:ankyrin repeat protein
MTLTTIDAQDMHGFTPLTIAVMNGKLDFMELLIERHAQVNQVDKEKHSLVHWAVVCGQV